MQWEDERLCGAIDGARSGGSEATLWRGRFRPPVSPLKKYWHEQQAFFNLVVEVRGISSRASTALGQAALTCHWHVIHYRARFDSLTFQYQIMIPRRSRGFFFDGHSPMLLATCHVTLVRSGTCISLSLATRKRAQLTQMFPIVSCSPA